MGRVLEQAATCYPAAVRDIYRWCHELNFKPSWQQRQLLDIFQKHVPGRPKRLRVACKSGQGPGKTKVAGVIAGWLLIQERDSMGIVTAPTMRQCKNAWLLEFGRTLEGAQPWVRRFIKTTKTRVYVAKRDKWLIDLVTASTVEGAQGAHQKRLFVVVEEASGVARGIIEQYKGTLSNHGGILFLIGNPNKRDCAFFDCFNKDAAKWHKTTFNAEESPPEIVDPARNKELEEEFGRESNVYRVRVLGEFPLQDSDCVMSDEVLRNLARKEHLQLELIRETDSQGEHIKQFGIDLARFGGDESVIYRRSGNSVVQWEKFAHREPLDIIAIAFRWQEEAGWKDEECTYVFDADGLGGGVGGAFSKTNKRVVEFHAGSKAIDPKYENKATEAYFTLAKRVKNSEVWLHPDETLIFQLSSRQYSLDAVSGRIVIESKKVYCKRGPNPSPDRADALTMAFYDAHRDGAEDLTVGLDEDDGYWAD